jgi:quercetin dioxygenase-like cupin family protein
MILCKAEKIQSKGWYAGPWNSDLSISVGYANEGINEKHYHTQMYELYLIASGKSTAVVNDQEVRLAAGDLLIVEPGEAHTFISNSTDYFHFVIHTPFVSGDKLLLER